LAGPIDPETGVPRTKYLTLSGITSPDFSTFDKENPRQAPLGFKAREYLRNLIQGQKVEFAIEHKIKDSNDKVVGHLKFNGEDVALEMLRKGLVQVREGSKAHNVS
jgi:endonuclease YncB( thermonuclease family)